MSKKLQEILDRNKEFEQQSPYNFCDRWCERCVYEKQVRCTLYQDELEQKMICIAHGKEPYDLQITQVVMEAQHKKIEEKLAACMDKYDIGLDNPDIDEDGVKGEDAVDIKDLPLDIKKYSEFMENNHLQKTSEQYRKKVQDFLRKTFFKKEYVRDKFANDFEIVTWYHTLLPTKISRALAGFHKPACEVDFSLYDSVAQFEICRKAVNMSIKALDRLKEHYSEHKILFRELIALLHNISSRIKLIEDEI